MYFNIYRWLLRCSTAKGSSTGLVPVGPPKVKACKSILVTEGTPKVEIKSFCIFHGTIVTVTLE